MAIKKKDPVTLTVAAAWMSDEHSSELCLCGAHVVIGCVGGEPGKWVWTAGSTTGIQPHRADAERLVELRLESPDHKDWMRRLDEGGYRWVNREGMTHRQLPSYKKE